MEAYKELIEASEYEIQDDDHDGQDYKKGNKRP
jgi:hypothetical protein